MSHLASELCAEFILCSTCMVSKVIQVMSHLVSEVMLRVCSRW